MANGEKANRGAKPASLLKSSGVKAKFDEVGNLTFIVPKHIEEKIRAEYNFSVEQLSVGGDIPLGDLAVHVD